MKLNVLKVLGRAASLMWMINGMIIVGSIYFSKSSFAINLIIGSLLFFTGMYFYWKNLTLLLFLEEYDNIKNRLFNKVIISEIIFNIITFFIGVIILCAIAKRVFIENFSVFD